MLFFLEGFEQKKFSLMIDSIAVSLLAGFQVLGDSSEYV